MIGALVGWFVNETEQMNEKVLATAVSVLSGAGVLGNFPSCFRCRGPNSRILVLPYRPPCWIHNRNVGRNLGLRVRCQRQGWQIVVSLTYRRIKAVVETHRWLETIRDHRIVSPIIVAVALLVLGLSPSLAQTYPEQLMGTWGSRAAYAGDDNPAQAAKACQAFRNPNSTETADILVFLSKKKYSYGGYADYFDDNVSVDKIALNRWSIIDRHYYDGEGAKAAGLRNLAYQVQIDGDILTINEGNDISRFNRCPDPSRPLSVSMEEWTKQLVEVLNKSKRYPPDAQRQRLAGLVILGLVINRSGRLMDSQIKQSSGFDLLDKGIA